MATGQMPASHARRGQPVLAALLRVYHAEAALMGQWRAMAQDVDRLHGLVQHMRATFLVLVLHCTSGLSQYEHDLAELDGRLKALHVQLATAEQQHACAVGEAVAGCTLRSAPRYVRVVERIAGRIMGHCETVMSRCQPDAPVLGQAACEAMQEVLCDVQACRERMAGLMERALRHR